MNTETEPLRDDLSHDHDGPGTRHPTDHLPARRTRANITYEQHAEDHDELHHTAGHDLPEPDPQIGARLQQGACRERPRPDLRSKPPAAQQIGERL